MKYEHKAYKDCCGVTWLILEEVGHMLLLESFFRGVSLVHKKDCYREWRPRCKRCYKNTFCMSKKAFRKLKKHMHLKEIPFIKTLMEAM